MRSECDGSKRRTRVPVWIGRYPLARLAAVAALAATLLAGCGGSGSRQAAPLVVGAVEDAAKFGDALGKMGLAKRAGFAAVALSAVWTPPLTEPSPGDLAGLRAAVDAAAADGIRPIVAVYSFSSVTPLSPGARAQFAAFAASIPRLLPAVRDVIIGNEPNLNLFWMPQFGTGGSDAAASSYLQLLAESYDAIKAVSPSVNVIGGAVSARGSDDPNASRPTHSPTRFLLDLGAAYQRSGRKRPIMDMLSLHPYPENSSIPPDFAHPKTTTIGLADYGKLVDILARAFDETAQPGRGLPIVYGEYGLQTTIPPEHAAAYTGTEQPTIHPISPEEQGQRYAEAIRLVACQPTARMLLFFHVSDEPRLEGLQTGVYYADDAPKASLAAVAAAAKAAEAGKLSC